MQIDRAAVMRGLSVVNVNGIEQIVIFKDGTVCAASPDRTVFVYGNIGVGELDEDWALPDIGLFQRMLKSFTSAKIDIVRQRNSFSMTGDGIQWRYRLGNKEILQTLKPEDLDKVLKSMKQPVDISIDVMKRLAGIQSTIRASYIHFVSHGGSFKILVGEADTYSGSIDLEVSPKDDFDLKIPADRLTTIIDKLDEPSVTLRFGVDSVKAVRVALPKFSWLIGAICEDGEKTKDKK